MSTVFIAGATGVLGRRLVRAFRARGDRVLGLARRPENVALLKDLGAEARPGDLFDLESLSRAAGGAEVVIHAATAIPTGTPRRVSDFATNDRIRTDGTRALAEAAARVGAGLYLQQSITWLVRSPDGAAFDEDSAPDPDPLARSGLAAEEIAREAGRRHGHRVGILRGGVFYAEDAAASRDMARALLRGRLPIVGSGETRWSLIHADDMARAFVAAVEREGWTTGLWHVVDDRPIATGEFFRLFARMLKAPEPRRLPRWMARIVAGRLAVEFLTTPKATSNARIKAELGWAPRFPTVDEGLRAVVDAWGPSGP